MDGQDKQKLIFRQEEGYDLFGYHYIQFKISSNNKRNIRNLTLYINPFL